MHLALRLLPCKKFSNFIKTQSGLSSDPAQTQSGLSSNTARTALKDTHKRSIPMATYVTLIKVPSADHQLYAEKSDGT